MHKKISIKENHLKVSTKIFIYNLVCVPLPLYARELSSVLTIFINDKLFVLFIYM